MEYLSTITRLILYFWLGVFGIGFTDMAIQLQSETIKAYQKGVHSGHRLYTLYRRHPLHFLEPEGIVYRFNSCSFFIEVS